ncbi:MAG: O-antigen ligase family protein, partial [bacterium]
NIIIGCICFAGVLFFGITLMEVNPDFVALAAIVLIVFFGIRDKRFLLAGWFLVSPYFSPFGVEGMANIASNFSHNIIVPIISIIILSLSFAKQKRIAFGKEELLLLCFVGYAFLSSFFATKGRYDDLRMIYLIYLIPFFLYLVVKNIRIDTKLFQMFAYVSIFHIVAVSMMCAYETVTGEVLYHSQLDWNDVGSGHRFGGPFGSPIILGLFVPTVFFYIYLACKFELIPRYVMWVSAVLATVLILATFTRSVWLGAFVAFIYVMYKTGREGKTQLLRLAMFAAAAVLIVGVITIVSPAVQQRLTGEENANFRVVMAEASLNMIKDKPLVGWGAGTFDDNSDRYLFDALGVYIVKDTSHVTLLTILAELGMLGGLLFLLFIYFNLSHKGVKMSDLPPDDQLIVALNIGGVLIFAINGFLIDMRFYSVAYSWFFINMGFIYSMYRDHAQQNIAIT